MRIKPLTLTIVAVALLATACQKNEERDTPATEVSEGQFNPGKKLSKIYQTVQVKMNGVTRTVFDNILVEDWTWDGDKLVKVDYYSSGELEESVRYIYSGDVITQMQKTYAYDDIVYEDGKLKEIKEYDLDGTLLRMIAVTKRDGNKITEFTLIEYAQDNALPDSKHVGALQNLLRILVPDNAAEQIATATTKDIAAKGGNVFEEITLIWEGDNIVQVIFDHFDYEIRMFYEYDNMKSPFHGFVGYIGRAMYYCDWGSRNNIVMDSISAPSMGENECVHFTYEYDDHYPVKSTHYIRYNEVDGTVVKQYVYVE